MKPTSLTHRSTLRQWPPSQPPYYTIAHETSYSCGAWKLRDILHSCSLKNMKRASISSTKGDSYNSFVKEYTTINFKWGSMSVFSELNTTSASREWIPWILSYSHFLQNLCSITHAWMNGQKCVFPEPRNDFCKLIQIRSKLRFSNWSFAIARPHASINPNNQPLENV